jgi:hypothetical protein
MVRRRARRPRPPRRRIRPLGCLLWVLGLVILLLILSLLFGGFQTGTKVGLGRAPASPAVTRSRG